MTSNHGPECLRAQVRDDLTDMCPKCRANRIAEEYSKAIFEKDVKLLEAVWAAADNDNLLRKELEMVSLGALQSADEWDVPEQAVENVEARHEFIKSKIR